MDWLDLLVVQGTRKSLLQHHSSRASVLWCLAFFVVQLSYPYEKKHSFDHTDLLSVIHNSRFLKISENQKRKVQAAHLTANIWPELMLAIYGIYWSYLVQMLKCCCRNIDVLDYGVLHNHILWYRHHMSLPKSKKFHNPKHILPQRFWIKYWVPAEPSSW